MNSLNEQLLANAIHENETVKWEGSPLPYNLLDADHKKSTMRFWLLSIAIMAVLSIIYTAYVISNATADVQPFVYILTIGFPLLLFVDPIRDRGFINQQGLAITDSRVIIVHKSMGDNNAVSLPFDRIDVARIEEVSPGINRVRFGSASFPYTGFKLRRQAISGTLDDNEKVTGMVFYQVAADDCEKICTILNESSVSLKKEV